MIDKKAELYYGWSPYTYALNTPINAIDPDGRLVIFINGNHYGDGGKAEYWRTYNSNHQETYAFDKSVMNQVGDHHAIYRDGSLGGFAPFNRNNILNSDERQNAGYIQGLKEAETIINSLARDPNGNINESIKLITHSMGGSYGKGYVKALLHYAKMANIPNVNIAFEADFAPFQPGKQKAVNGVKTLQFSNDNDPVANNNTLGSPFAKEEGAEVTTDNSKDKGHSITDFADKVKNLPVGKYKVVNGEIVPE